MGLDDNFVASPDGGHCQGSTPGARADDTNLTHELFMPF
jgi:hypothetical protein